MTRKKHLSSLKHFPSKEARLALDAEDSNTSARTPDGSSKYEEKLEVITRQLVRTHCAQVFCLSFASAHFTYYIRHIWAAGQKAENGLFLKIVY